MMEKMTGSKLDGSTLSIGALEEGFVLDHIEAGPEGHHQGRLPD